MPKHKQGRVKLSTTQAGSGQGLSPAQSLRGLLTVAPQPNSQTADRLKQLSTVLGAAAPTLANFVQRQEDHDTQTQLDQLDFYTQQFLKDHQAGTVSQTQIKDQLPELSPIVAARIAESTGAHDARQWVEEKLSTVMGNDKLRLSTQDRHAYRDAVMTEAQEFIGDNKFYGTGFLQQVNNSFNQFETSWQYETAAYQENLQKEEYGTQLRAALTTGKALTEIDQMWGQSSSLNDLERADILLDTVLKAAVTDRNPDYLTQLPEKLQQTAADKVQKTRTLIRDMDYQDFVRQKQRAAYQEDQTRQKRMQQVLEQITEDAPVDLADYTDDPSLYDWVKAHVSPKQKDPTASAYAKTLLKSRLRRAAQLGDFTQAFQEDPTFLQFFSDTQPTEENLANYIYQTDQFTAADKQNLLAELPTLMSGYNALRDPDLTTFYNLRVKSTIDSYMGSVEGQTRALKGQDLGALLTQNFYDSYAASREAYLQDHQAEPKGQENINLFRQAEQETNDLLRQIRQQPIDTPPPTGTYAPTLSEDGTGVLSNGVTFRKLKGDD